MLRHRQHRLGHVLVDRAEHPAHAPASRTSTGRAVLTITSPVVIGDKKATSFANGYACWRLRQDPAFATVADSFVDCDGGTRTNVTYSVNSNGSGARLPPVLTIDTAADGARPAGAGIIRILMQSSETGSDSSNCDTINWASVPDQAVAIATGQVTTTITNMLQGGTGTASRRGNPFNCAALERQRRQPRVPGLRPRPVDPAQRHAGQSERGAAAGLIPAVRTELLSEFNRFTISAPLGLIENQIDNQPHRATSSWPHRPRARARAPTRPEVSHRDRHRPATVGQDDTLPSGLSQTSP